MAETSTPFSATHGERSEQTIARRRCIHPSTARAVRSAGAPGASSPMTGSGSAPPAPTAQTRESTPSAPAASAAAPANATAASSSGAAVESRLCIGVNIKLKGVEISDCDVVVIEGHAEATVNSKTMEIAEPGTYKGTALIDVAEIWGDFSGELTAHTRLVVHGTPASRRTPSAMASWWSKKAARSWATCSESPKRSRTRAIKEQRSTCPRPAPWARFRGGRRPRLTHPVVQKRAGAQAGPFSFRSRQSWLPTRSRAASGAYAPPWRCPVRRGRGRAGSAPTATTSALASPPARHRLRRSRA